MVPRVAGFDPARERYVCLATFRRDGREVRTPVWLAGGGGRFYVFSEGDAGKVKRIRATGRVRVASCDARGRLKSESWLEGRGRVLREPAEIERAYRALHEKYGWQMRAADFFSRLTGRYARRALLELELGDAGPQA
jgi:hypothetical protein